MSYMYHRTWFPFILIGLSVGLLLVIVVFVEGGPRTKASTSEAFVAPIESVDYPGDISSILADFEATGDVERARDRLLAQRVPASYRDVHFELIFIIDAYQRGEETQANQRLEALRTQNVWLP